jgi:2-(1,2-epoxy-1,2-dihydrophenyl)acetyl-CoA isomerase
LSTYEHLIVERDGAVATLTLNRPERLNAFTDQTVRELLAVLAELSADREVRAVILTGAGRGFCTGADVRDRLAARLGQPSQRNHMGASHQLANALYKLEKPVIAAVNGPAAGAGMSLALACDLILASESASFNQVFVKRGLVPDLASLYHLPRLVGLWAAKLMMYTGDSIPAAEAERLGLVYRVLPADELLPAARELAGRMASVAPIALGLTKALVNRSLESNLADMLEFESLAQAMARGSKDHQEAVKAFLEKRPAEFHGE